MAVRSTWTSRSTSGEPPGLMQVEVGGCAVPEACTRIPLCPRHIQDLPMRITQASKPCLVAQWGARCAVFLLDGRRWLPACQGQADGGIDRRWYKASTQSKIVLTWVALWETVVLRLLKDRITTLFRVEGCARPAKSGVQNAD